mmetsp:Transcript_6176/g.15317  ORF Transcript_6176/g.15317 Transcript_6176/m.15317 type:complete len:201 (-) Transcript_6176:238-840(-)
MRHRAGEGDTGRESRERGADQPRNVVQAEPRVRRHGRLPDRHVISARRRDQAPGEGVRTGGAGDVGRALQATGGGRRHRAPLQGDEADHLEQRDEHEAAEGHPHEGHDQQAGFSHRDRGDRRPRRRGRAGRTVSAARDAGRRAESRGRVGRRHRDGGRRAGGGRSERGEPGGPRGRREHDRARGDWSVRRATGAEQRGFG